MFGVISRFLITPRVFALFESGLSLRCLPFLPFKLPVLFEKLPIYLFTDIENLKTLVLSNLDLAHLCFRLQRKAFKHLCLLRAYKPYALLQ
jgi:hypothetical protein